MQCDIPVVVIAFHGAYTKNEPFDSPINASKINASSIGACNLLTAAVPNAIPESLEELRMDYDCPTMVKKLRERLYSLDHEGMYLRKGKILTYVERWAKQEASSGDRDAKVWIKNIPRSYQTYYINKGEKVQNKTYSIQKDDVWDDEDNPYDDRIVLFFPDGSEKDIVTSWKKGDYSLFATDKDPDDPKDRKRPATNEHYYYEEKDRDGNIVGKEGPEGLVTDLKTIFETVRNFGFNDVIIIDLACNNLRFPQDREGRHAKFDLLYAARLGVPHGGLRKSRTRKPRTRKPKIRKPRTRKYGPQKKHKKRKKKKN